MEAMKNHLYLGTLNGSERVVQPILIDIGSFFFFFETLENANSE